MMMKSPTTSYRLVLRPTTCAFTGCFVAAATPPRRRGLTVRTVERRIVNVLLLGLLTGGNVLYMCYIYVSAVASCVVLQLDGADACRL